MKRTYFMQFLCILLVACNNIVESPTISTPSLTNTPTSTFTPTIAPTITQTPTVTPDPDKPTDATGIDISTGAYTKTVVVNQKTIVFFWKKYQFGDDAQNGIKGHWFSSMMKDGAINLTGYDEKCAYWGDGFPLNMNVYAVEGQKNLDKFGNIYHPDRAEEWKKNNELISGGGEGGGLSCSELSLAEEISRDLYFRYLEFPKEDTKKQKNEKYSELCNSSVESEKQKCDPKKFVDFINNGGTIQVGNEFWSPLKGYDFYWINEDMAKNDPTMYLSVQASGAIQNFYWKLFVENEKLVVVMAPSLWLKQQFVRDKVKRELMFKTIILFPLQAITAGYYPNEKTSLLPFQHYGSITGTTTLSITSRGLTIYIKTPFIDFGSD